MAQPPHVARLTVAFAGGGTGGHIYPNVAISEALRSRRPELSSHFIVSRRPGDATTMNNLGVPWLATDAQPLPSLRKPMSAVRFATGLGRGTRAVAHLLRTHAVDAVVATGGFVCGPAVAAARMLGIPAVMVNLDAIPGAANRALVRVCTKVFSAYATPRLPGAQAVGLPLRAAAVSTLAAPAARRALGLAADRPCLFVTGATHGAESVIRACMAMVAQPGPVTDALASWQVLHQCGTFDVEAVAEAYRVAGVTAKVVDYLADMGNAYAAADLVLSRAGAGSVAEAWAGGCPTIFLPNPYHADQHQRHNAQPMVDGGGALMVTDHIEPTENARTLGPVLAALLSDSATRGSMRAAAVRSRPPDGAKVIATWLDEYLA